MSERLDKWWQGWNILLDRDFGKYTRYTERQRKNPLILNLIMVLTFFFFQNSTSKNFVKSQYTEYLPCKQ